MGLVVTSAELKHCIWGSGGAVVFLYYNVSDLFDLV